LGQALAYGAFAGAVLLSVGLFTGSVTFAELVKPGLLLIALLCIAALLAKLSLKYRTDLPPEKENK